MCTSALIFHLHFFPSHFSQWDGRTCFDLPQKLRINKLKALLKWRTSRFCNTHMWQWLISFVFCFPLNWLAQGLSNVIVWHLFFCSHSDAFSSLFKREWLNIKDRAFFFQVINMNFKWNIYSMYKAFFVPLPRNRPCQKVHPLWVPPHHNMVIKWNMGIWTTPYVHFQWVVLQIDVANVFNTISHGVIFELWVANWPNSSFYSKLLCCTIPFIFQSSFSTRKLHNYSSMGTW
jgi:hypothetical protein